MTPRRKRFAIVGGVLVAVAAAVALILNAFQSNLVFFYSPTQVVQHEAPGGRSFRIGGMVEQGTLKRDGTHVEFIVTDTARSVPVRYVGILPDLFKEGKGVVAQGKLEDGVFVAREILAKHDENYVPPEAADAMKRAQEGKSQKLAETVVPSAAAPDIRPGGRTDERTPHPVIPELGHFALWLALGASFVAGTVPMLGAARGRIDWMAVARPSIRVVFVLVALAFVCLAVSFETNDFSVLYVASNSNRLLPLHYRLAAVWGGHEGSILLWVLMLTFWAAAVAQFSRHLPDVLVARILAVMGWLAFGFLLFMLTTSNPFDRLFPAAAEGRDLNPLLQDPGMVIHPPMLYMGYVGLSVAFAFAVAALIGGQLDATWARWTRPWTTAAWIFLTIGIALGSGWAYYELGWGGWWFWDPVENASFMPWLVATALIHSLAVTEKRGSFKSWTVLLAILAFSLSLLGTFLVRSGVLSSVHAFATDPKRGLFILAFLVIVIGASLTLYAWRAPKVGLGARFAFISRETLLLANNVLLVVACGAVLLGTLYPLALDALMHQKISVGPPYFDTVFVPLLAPLVFLVGVGPLARWKEAHLPALARRLRWAAGTAIVATIVATLVHGELGIVGALGLLMAFWIVASVVTDLAARLSPVAGGNVAVFERARLIPRSMVGMFVAHLGVAVFIVGVTLVKAGEVERDVKMDIGDTTTIGAYQFTFRGAHDVDGPNYRAAQGAIDITKDGSPVATLRPEKRLYTATQAVMTNAAIDSGFARDLYVSLGEPITDKPGARPAGTWIVRIYYKPFVDWIWGGCGIMALGGLLAATDRRYRSRKSAAKAVTASAAPPREALAT